MELLGGANERRKVGQESFAVPPETGVILDQDIFTC